MDLNDWSIMQNIGDGDGSKKIIYADYNLLTFSIYQSVDCQPLSFVND